MAALLVYKKVGYSTGPFQKSVMRATLGFDPHLRIYVLLHFNTKLVSLVWIEFYNSISKNQLISSLDPHLMILISYHSLYSLYCTASPSPPLLPSLHYF